MVKAEGAPSIILSRLDDNVGIAQRGTEERLDEASPVLLLARIGRPHIIKVDLGDLALAVPLVPCRDHLLNARAVHAVDAAEDADIGQLAGFLGRESLLDELLLSGYRALGDIVRLLLLTLRRDELNGLGDERQT